MKKRSCHIIFRNLGDKVPPECTAHINWQVEFYDGRSFPSGLAWVLAWSEAPKKKSKKKQTVRMKAHVQFVLVADDSRRQGIATRLIEACRERWPGVNLSPPISTGGLALYRKLQAPPTAEKSFNQKFIKQFLREGGTREQLEQMAKEQHEARLAFDEHMIELTEQRS